MRFPPVFVIALFLAGATRAFAAPPANDNFANATDLGTAVPVTRSGTNADATLEPGEPLPVATAVASVWLKWTAPATAHFQIDTNGSSPDTTLGIYTGTAAGALTTVASNNNATASVTWSQVIFPGAAGVTYRIQVMSAQFGRGNCVVNIKQRPPHGADVFAQATDLGQTATATGSGYIDEATQETGEPDIPTGFWDRSLWWKWKAPSTGVVEVNTVGSKYNTALAAYTGSSVNALTRVAWNNDINNSAGQTQSLVRFPATAGTTYLIQVSGGSSTKGDTLLEIKPGPVPPSNDSFAGATNLGAVSSAAVDGTNVNATLEVAEPVPGNEQLQRQSVWWRWTAPGAGQVELNTSGSGFNTMVGVFTGLSVSSLTQVAFNDDAPQHTSNESKVAFLAVPGQTYHIQVSGYTGTRVEGAVKLSLTSGLAGAVNDNFTAATNLGSVATATVTGTNIGATLEPGEPVYLGTGSVWWRWTAPATGPVEFNTQDSEIDTCLAVYSGSSLATLARIIVNSTAHFEVSGGVVDNRWSVARIHAISGTTYYLQVTGESGGEDPDRGNIKLTVKPVAGAPANDNFAAAVNLGSAATVDSSVDATSATVEAGEPAPPREGPQTVNGWALHATVWWKWTAPATGWVSIRSALPADPDGIYNLIGIYTGSSLPALQFISDGRLRATAGTVYMIQGTPQTGDARGGPISLEIRPLPDPPANDNLDNAIDLGAQATLSVSGTLLNASKEPGEPNPDYISEFPLGSTVWWKWTAQTTGRVLVNTTGALVTPYNGTPALNTLVGNWNIQETETSASYEWQVIAGVTYYLQARTAFETGEGPFNFQVSASATPATGYAGWIKAIAGFTVAQQHPKADPDMDGVPNGLEHALGRTPNEKQPVPYTVETVVMQGSTWPAVHFTLPAGRTVLVNALLFVEESTDLQTWQIAGEEFSNGNWSLNTERWTEGGVTHIRIRSSTPISGAQPRAYLRLGARVIW